jgi:hypothetical protein
MCLEPQKSLPLNTLKTIKPECSLRQVSDQTASYSEVQVPAYLAAGRAAYDNPGPTAVYYNHGLTALNYNHGLTAAGAGIASAEGCRTWPTEVATDLTGVGVAGVAAVSIGGEHSRYIQGTMREHSWNVEGTLREDSRNVEETFREHSAFGEHSGAWTEAEDALLVQFAVETAASPAMNFCQVPQYSLMFLNIPFCSLEAL